MITVVSCWCIHFHVRWLSLVLCPEMLAVKKISDLTNFPQITRDWFNMLANLTILVVVMQIGIMSYPSGAEDFDELKFVKAKSALKNWRQVKSACGIHDDSCWRFMLIRVENFDDFYANYIIRDEPNMFANDDFSDLYANYILSDSREAESKVPSF